MVANEHKLLDASNERNEALGLGRLRRLVEEKILESTPGDARVACAAARAADDIGSLQYLLLELAPQLYKLPHIRVAKVQVVLFFHQAAELLAVRRPKFLDHRVETQRGDAAALEIFPRLGLDAHNAHARSVYLFGELIDCNVAGRYDEHLAFAALCEMVHYRSGGHSFASSGGPWIRRAAARGLGAQRRFASG